MKENKKQSVIKRLMKYSGNKKFLVYLSMFLSTVSSILILLPMFYIHRIVKSMILNGNIDFHLVKENIIYAVIFPVIGVILYVLASMFSHIFAFEVEKNLIKYSMQEIMKKPLGYFSNIESGRLRNTVIAGAAETHTVLAHQMPDLLPTFVSPVMVLIMLFLFDWRLGIASIIPIFIGMGFMFTMMTSDAKKDREEYYENINKLSAETVEYIRGIPVVKTFGQSVESFKGVYASIINIKDSVLNMTKKFRNKMSLFETFSGATAFFLIPVALLLILKGNDPKVIISDFIIYLLIGPIFGVLIMKSAVVQSYLFYAEQALNKIENALEYPDQIFGYENNSKGGIEFKNVSFSYENEKILDNISFKINEGETVALVGKSGGGKSTIAKLAARFYDVDSGEVSIGGVNIKDFDKNHLMNKISFVFQNSKLFKKSLRENIVLGKKDATDDEIMQAIIKASAKEIIDKFDKGLDTIYGTKGTYLSGGEMQRIIIARAFLKDAKYVILDEATAFADPENESIIQKSFKLLSKNKTTLLIAHRLSTVVDVDRILVIDDGKIVEEGSHKELLEKGNIYKKLWDEYQRSINWKIGGEND